MPQNRNNFFSTAKGIGIILMAMGHCGAPGLLGKLIYQFHMPLFFFCSGYFLKDIINKDTLFLIYKKRFKGIYVKFFCWSILFLSLHNAFFHLNIYNDIVLFRGQPSYLYNTSDFLYKASKIILSMNEHEQLVRSFWFLKQLFLSSIIVPTLLYLTNKTTKNRHACLLVFIVLFIMTLFSKYYGWTLPAIWDISLILMSSTFYISGFIFRKYHVLDYLKNIIIPILCLSILLIGLFTLPWTNMLEYTTTTTIPFFVVAFSGIVLTIIVAMKIDGCKIRYPLYYIGQNTMVIFALHMLCFKLGNLLKIAIYDIPIYRLADFQIIYDHNTMFWIVYTIIGISIPLLIDLFMKSSRYTKRIWSFFV